MKGLNKHIEDSDVCEKGCGTLWNIVSIGKTSKQTNKQAENIAINNFPL